MQEKEGGMPLVFAPRGETMQVVKIRSDRKTEKHLENLGIVSGADISVLSEGGGSMIVQVKDVRLAIDPVVARSIFVRRAG